MQKRALGDKLKVIMTRAAGGKSPALLLEYQNYLEGSRNVKWLIGILGVLVLAAFAGFKPAQGYLLFAIGCVAIGGVVTLFEKSESIDPSGAKKDSAISTVALGIALLGAIIFTFWIAKSFGWP